MNYQKIYESIINKAKLENRLKENGKYYENHHIIPKCIGGTDDKENKILLTAREHYVCHKLLCYIHSENTKIIYAFHMMTCVNKNKKYISARDYELARSLRSNKSLSYETKEKLSIKSSGKHNGMFKNGKKLQGSNNGAFGKNYHTWGLKKYNKKRKGKTYEEFYGIKKSKQIKDNMSNSRIGLKHTEKSKQKMSAAQIGKHHEHIKKICPHCGLIGKGPNMTRYHFNNCKFKK